MPWYDMVGFFGVFSYLFSYWLLQSRRLGVDSYRYSLLNLIGALALLISLLYNLNLPSLFAQVMWMIISLMGLYKTKQHKTARTTS
jgi:hypothetical protein